MVDQALHGGMQHGGVRDFVLALSTPRQPAQENAGLRRQVPLGAFLQQAIQGLVQRAKDDLDAPIAGCLEESFSHVGVEVDGLAEEKDRLAEEARLGRSGGEDVTAHATDREHIELVLKC